MAPKWTTETTADQRLSVAYLHVNLENDEHLPEWWTIIKTSLCLQIKNTWVLKLSTFLG